VIADLECVVLDCADPRALADFYQAILGGAVNRPDPRWSLDPDWSTLHTPSGPVLAFQRVADHRPPRWPEPAHPQQFHLDFGVPDLDAAQERVLALGATLLDAGTSKRSWRVYADPAGHPFCLVRRRAPAHHAAG
jgi:catechol 2,3-dioxygenase-like lactoylglutathione lyase family enzyme